MKELVSIATYCPTLEKKVTLYKLLLNLQQIREFYDLIIVSHSPIDNTCFELVDYVIYDKKNEPLTDFDLTNKFYFENEHFKVNSSVVFPLSTHLTIYELLQYTINFAKYKGYQKIHYMEYDFNFENIEILSKSSKALERYDNFLLKDFKTEWTFGFYFAFKLENLEVDEKYSKEKILNELRLSYSKITEHIIHNFLSKNRTTFYEDINSPMYNKKYRLIDSHNNYFLNWVVPLYNLKNNSIDLFVYNEHGGDYSINVGINEKIFKLPCPKKNQWYLQEIEKVTNTQDIKIYVDNKITKNIKITSENFEKFKEHNSIEFK